MTVFLLWDTNRGSSDSLGAYKTSLTVICFSPDGGWGQRSSVGGPLLSPQGMLGNGMGDLGQMELFGCNLWHGLDSRHDEGLMLDLGPQPAAIMAIKSQSRDKESCKSNPILDCAHMLAVIQLRWNNLMSHCIFSAVIQHHYWENWF